VPYLGYTCEHSDVYVVATTTCLGVVELDVSMELYDVAQNDTACSALKFMVAYSFSPSSPPTLIHPCFHA
jgi:hypothetical protein